MYIVCFICVIFIFFNILCYLLLYYDLLLFVFNFYNIIGNEIKICYFSDIYLKHLFLSFSRTFGYRSLCSEEGSG